MLRIAVTKRITGILTYGFRFCWSPKKRVTPPIIITACSSTDRIRVSEACDTGSIPVKQTKRRYTWCKNAANKPQNETTWQQLRLR